MTNHIDTCFKKVMKENQSLLCELQIQRGQNIIDSYMDEHIQKLEEENIFLQKELQEKDRQLQTGRTREGTQNRHEDSTSISGTDKDRLK